MMRLLLRVRCCSIAIAWIDGDCALIRQDWNMESLAAALASVAPRRFFANAVYHDALGQRDDGNSSLEKKHIRVRTEGYGLPEVSPCHQVTKS